MIRRTFLAALLGTAALAVVGPVFASPVPTPVVLGSATSTTGTSITVTTGVAAPANSSIFNFGVNHGSLNNIGAISDSAGTPYTSKYAGIAGAGTGHTQLAYAINTPGLPLGGTVTMPVPTAGTAGNYLISVALTNVVVLWNPDGTWPQHASNGSTGPAAASLALDPVFNTASLNSGAAFPQHGMMVVVFGFGNTSALALSEAQGFTTLASVPLSGDGLLWVSYYAPATPAPVFYDPTFANCAWIAWMAICQPAAPTPPAFPPLPLPITAPPPTWGLLQNFALPGSPLIATSVPLFFPRAQPNAHIQVIGVQSPTYATQMAAIGAEIKPLGGFLVPRVTSAPPNTDGQQDVTSVMPVGSTQLAAYATNLTATLTAALPYMGPTPYMQLEKEIDLPLFQVFGPSSQQCLAAFIDDGSGAGSYTGNPGNILTWPSGTPPTPGLGTILVGAGSATFSLVTTGNTHRTTTLDGLASLAGVTVGMTVPTGPDFAAGTIVAAINSGTSVTLNQAAISSANGIPATFAGYPVTSCTISSGSFGTYFLTNITTPSGLQAVAPSTMQWGTAQQIAGTSASYYFAEMAVAASVCQSLGVTLCSGAILHYDLPLARWQNLRAAGRNADADEIMAQIFSVNDFQQLAVGIPNALRSDIGIYDYLPQQAIKFYLAPLLLAGIKGAGAQLANWHWKAGSTSMNAPHDVMTFALAQTGLTRATAELWTLGPNGDPNVEVQILLEGQRLGLEYCTTTAGLANTKTGALTPMGQAAANVFNRTQPSSC